MTETQDQAFKEWNKSGHGESLKNSLIQILSSRIDMTDRELSDMTGEDINAINRARYDLVNEGYVCESQKRRCSITNSYVIAWRLGKSEKKDEYITERELQHIQKLSLKANEHQKKLIRLWFK